MKKILAILVALVLVMGMSSVAMADAALPKIGIITPDADHGFTGESVAHARAEAEALKEAGVIADYMLGVGGEASKQIQALDDIMTWGPDAVVLWPLEGDQLRNAAQGVVDEGVPLIIYDRLIENFAGMKAEIMGDNEKIGNMMGEYLLTFFAPQLEAGETITYLLFIGDSSTVSKQRTQGMVDIIEASPYKDNFKLLQDGFQTDWSNAKAQEFMENWLTTADAETIADLDMIVTHDDEIVDGITTALTPDLTSLKVITSVGGRRETLSTYNGKTDPELLTYFFSPSYIREAIRLGAAAAKGEQYQGQDIDGQLFLIPTIEIDKDGVAAYEASQEYIDRYSLD